MNAVLVTMYAALMHLVLLDRFLEIYLHLRYEIYCTVKRTKILIVVIFISLALSAIPQMALLEKDFPTIFLFYSSYVWPSVSSTFLVSSIIIYMYIYIKLNNLYKPTCSRRRRRRRRKIQPSSTVGSILVNDDSTHCAIEQKHSSPLLFLKHTASSNIPPELRQKLSTLPFIQSAESEININKTKSLVGDNERINKYFVQPVVNNDQEFDLYSDKNSLGQEKDHPYSGVHVVDPNFQIVKDVELEYRDCDLYISKKSDIDKIQTSTSSKYMQEDITNCDKTSSSTNNEPKDVIKPEQTTSPTIKHDLRITEERLRTRKKMFLPTLLIGSFLIFWVIPVMYMFSRHVSISGIATLPEYLVTNSLVGLGVCFDAFAYIFTYKPVRRYLNRILRRFR